ncbi:hypothetical protein METESE_13630 [Mesoterricola sediminis]|uniref:Uncharacterized protein n=1 Tax=Mesoterricola sediminis TaxID=2927980 RepID=A0AA48GVI0_9BACT|nr:hypothetical protein METESE_13630 [Mesoterricola sediminis]
MTPKPLVLTKADTFQIDIWLNKKGEPVSLRDHARYLLERAALPKWARRKCKPWGGGVVVLPWHGATEHVRVAYIRGKVGIHETDAGKPWGAALFLALEAEAPDRVILWQEGM